MWKSFESNVETRALMKRHVFERDPEVAIYENVHREDGQPYEVVRHGRIVERTFPLLHLAMKWVEDQYDLPIAVHIDGTDLKPKKKRTNRKPKND